MTEHLASFKRHELVQLVREGRRLSIKITGIRDKERANFLFDAFAHNNNSPIGSKSPAGNFCVEAYLDKEQDSE